MDIQRMPSLPHHKKPTSIKAKSTMTMPRQTPPQRRPPAQVYTRGTVGAVKTRGAWGDGSMPTHRRSRSQSRDTASSSRRNHGANSSQGSVQSRSVQSTPSKGGAKSPYSNNADTTKSYIKISKRVIEGTYRSNCLVASDYGHGSCMHA